MITEGVSDRLEDRLERLAKLHADGQLDDQEFKTAKAQLLTGTDPVAGSVTPTVRTLGPYRWTTWFLIALCVGFTLGCLSSAVTTLQRPAAPIVCSNGDYVAGSTAQHFGGTTSFNIDAYCVSPDGNAHHLSQAAIIGVLWLEYTLALCLVFAVMVWLIRGLRGPPRMDAPAVPTDQPR
ncbi:MAG: hypothetical protein JWN99_1817 [Ilumatobacteraceae bacterium]|nr:hypothetical protein [Ilumatobacteraceae bacterium]